MKNNTLIDMTSWTGRVDLEDGELGLRWHQKISEATSSSMNGIVLLGFACDEGVYRNKGRIGAYSAPQIIRRALSNLAWHHNKAVFDGGDTCCDDADLELAQHQLGDNVEQALANHNQVIVFGGGHEIAWGSFQGIARHLKSITESNQQKTPPRIGIINFDAHFDLRNPPQKEHLSEESTEQQFGSSGTPFHQISQYCEANGWPFNYACLGLNRGSNTQALYQKADDLSVLYFDDTEMTHANLPLIQQDLSHFIDQNDYLYLTIDIDVFPASVAPGVSAPAVRGVPLEIIETLIFDILAAKNPQGISKLLLADMAEFNPNFDIDNQTARLAARLAWTIAHGMKA
ncbi:formimidoylglutamase [Aliivibrio sp. S4TY2]|uniref:formimidoylglutamase n=1 Tax=unclassified Aliivibrio TaxID=2645654 RepID=UPI002378A00B|nr:MULTISPECIES: formimidoylglutamase [unclassified Aliivibrio]MDD9157920.1 formimidoylglutamase [Aliivibrio sp. S4TY2]MDD9161863.1 formimidoylglutamase [Aliivibrio sp. S4TY1]MDD9165920.1 formimidoylglutamase [Aliivibrio sp. S4MY2]MDD9169919.1 formimidoylglutamase [Aliivibrio sp. S4MY4]MDD9186970.1 formimidoylglutamase [Aliivibrio sp. S4MY3]